MKHLIMKQFQQIKSLTLVVLLASLCGLSGCNEDDDIKVLKLAHSLDRGHSVHQAMVLMGERLQELSGGSMRIDIYPSGQLGSERELMELLQIGSLAMTKVSASPMESFVPELKVFSIPYVFRDKSHFWKILDGDIGKRLLLAGERVRLRGLGYYDAGSRSFYTVDQPIHTPSDLQGKKIRVQKSQTSVKMVQSLGGSATPISWGELYTALQQGVVDGAENNPPSFYLSKHYEVCRFYTLDEHTYVPDMLLISSHIWGSLNEQQQQWLQLAADESIEHQKVLWQKSTAEALAAVEAAGVEIIRPDKTKFSDAVTEMHDSYKNTAIYELLEEIQAIR